ncbi:hypothetical protein [Streptomyces sp. enrichment culture]|uniref:hypothetical protein n=1 Tax=Streptomyces sp. enrichment culture TaxID=1795815 RepID=UPI003F544944
MRSPFRRLWNTARRAAWAAVRRCPFRPDPLASLVRTARGLDYGAGRLPEATDDARPSADRGR